MATPVAVGAPPHNRQVHCDMNGDRWQTNPNGSPVALAVPADRPTPNPEHVPYAARLAYAAVGGLAAAGEVFTWISDAMSSTLDNARRRAWAKRRGMIAPRPVRLSRRIAKRRGFSCLAGEVVSTAVPDRVSNPETLKPAWASSSWAVNLQAPIASQVAHRAAAYQVEDAR